MSPRIENPCLKGLTAGCFAHNPQWAKRAFAYRLLHTITPKKLTRRLPKGLRLALIAPGVLIPPGVELPPGATVPPGATIPPTWIAGDPEPPGITIPPGTSFPPDWTPADPVPPEIIIQPGSTFPPDWTPPDPIPPGSQPPPATPPATETTGTAPPTYTEPWAPGPVHPGIGTNPPLGANWEEQFNNTHWERYFLGSQPNWDGSKWVISSDVSVDLTVIGTWYAAYRPTKIRVTIDPPASTLQWLNLMDSGHNQIAYLQPYTNLAEVNITFTTLDILHLSFFDSNDGINITNIEFLP